MTADRSPIIGLSGGIGSGKSTVAKILAELGAKIIDADRVVREVQAPGSEGLREMVQAFGQEILMEDGNLDRKALGDIVFRNPEALARLNEIVHPKVSAEMARRLMLALESDASLVALDIPLLFEGRKAGTGTASLIPFDATVLVWVPKALQVERQISRDACDEGEAQRRIAAQMPIDEKRELADFIIDNSKSVSDTRKQVEELFPQLCNLKPCQPE
jgi:dephospho-CoA kinase